MNSKDAIVRMRDLEKLYNYHMDAGAEGLGWESAKEAKKIYDKFEDGCNFKFQTLVDGEINLCCGAIISDRGILLCKNCQEIKEVAIRFDTGIIQENKE